MRIRFSTPVLAALAILASTAVHAETKPIKIWNLTAATILELKLAPSGTTKFGRNLTKEDKDGEIDVDERLNLLNTPPGVYDAQIVLKGGRHCHVSALKLESGGIVSIEEQDLQACAP
ncbi:MAG: hypothetical protein P4M13_08085 [Alphaproteobacteria bacterium]|nr:hypothetical protein [Alphaproteobacteria bacterium]